MNAAKRHPVVQRQLDDAASTLAFYFERALGDLTSDNRSEITGVVESIFDAAVDQVRLFDKEEAV